LQDTYLFTDTREMNYSIIMVSMNTMDQNNCPTCGCSQPPRRTGWWVGPGALAKYQRANAEFRLFVFLLKWLSRSGIGQAPPARAAEVFPRARPRACPRACPREAGEAGEAGGKREQGRVELPAKYGSFHLVYYQIHFLF
jgi:hypothetical protein